MTASTLAGATPVAHAAVPSGCLKEDRHFVHVRDLPVGVRPAPGSMADPGEPYNEHDLVRYPGGPFRQLIDAVQHGCMLELRFAFGGIAAGQMSQRWRYTRGRWTLLASVRLDRPARPADER